TSAPSPPPMLLRFLVGRVIAGFRETECALIEIAARATGGFGDGGDRILERGAFERAAKQGVDVFRVLRRCVDRRRRDDDDEFAARLAALCIGGGERRKIAATDLLMQFGELATDCGFSAAETCRKVGQRRSEARTGFEQHQGCGYAGNLADA